MRPMRFFLGVVTGFCVLFGALSATAAQAPYVEKIQVGNAAPNSANGFYLTPSNGQRHGPTTLTKGQHVPPGTTIEAPANTQVTIRGYSGQSVVHQRSTLTIEASSSQGESFLVKAGKVGFSIIKKLGFFKVGTPGKRVQFAAPGTKFSVGVNDKFVSLDVKTGRVRRDKRVRVQVGQAASGRAVGRRPLETTQSQFFSAGNKPPPLSLDYYDREVKTYATYAQAEAEFQNTLKQQRGVQSLDAADDSLMLADLLLDSGRPRQAIPFYNAALGIYVKLLGSTDPDVADALIGLGEAYQAANDPGNAAKALGQALQIAKRQAESDRYYYQALAKDAATDWVDPEELWDAATDAEDSYEQLADVADLMGNRQELKRANDWAKHLRREADNINFNEGKDNLDEVDTEDEGEDYGEDEDEGDDDEGNEGYD